ncbi:hypothetical protein OG394_06165 [Kribbella sp. NBC_01245]|uniref:hypothetical protein n=1 Tax=Kribbella sp. NBC_01245 TaxID=2903578 RepID=UPI002E282C06|nr:hypothetical protein [Kribbella sp. NBC_01245]
MSGNDIADRVGALSNQDSERLLQAVMDRLLADTAPLEVDDEESARELVAAFVTRPDEPVAPDDVIRPSVDVDTYVRAALTLLVEDSETAPVVEESLTRLPDETQMFADPVTAALVLGVLVAFLQTKFDVKVSRKDGKVDFDFSVGKEAASDETVAKVVDAVRGVVDR